MSVTHKVRVSFNIRGENPQENTEWNRFFFPTTLYPTSFLVPETHSSLRSHSSSSSSDFKFV